MGLILSPALCLTMNNCKGAAYDSAATALFAAMSVQPNVARKAVINNLIVGLKGAGVWTKLGLLYINAAHNEQAGRLNWVNPGTNTLTAVNSPTFTTDRGFKSDGTTSYLDTGLKQTVLPNFARDDAHIASWVTGTSGTINFGLQNTGSLFNIAQASTRSSRVNSSVALSAVGDAIGGYAIATRRSASSVFSYKNGTAEISDLANTSTALDNTTNRTMCLLKTSSTFANAGMTIEAAHLGVQISATDAANFYSNFHTYMTAVGAA